LSNLKVSILFFDQVKNRIACQDEQISSLDGKSNFGLASATLLIAGITGLHKALQPLQQSTHSIISKVLPTGIRPELIIDSLTLFAIIVYVLVVATAYRAYKIRDFVVVPEPREFFNKYLYKPEKFTKETLLATMVEAFYINQGIVDKKLFWTSWVLRGLLVEIVFIFMLTILQIYS
jgi:hypothetical protein